MCRGQMLRFCAKTGVAAALASCAFSHEDRGSPAEKGELCTDGPSAAGLPCVGDGVLRFCAEAGRSEGPPSSIGKIQTATIAPPNSWRPRFMQFDGIADTVRTDICANCLSCFDGICSSSAKEDSFSPFSAEEQAKYVPLGSPCDGINSICKARQFCSLGSLILPREVRGACNTGVCLSLDPDYRVGLSGESGCGRLACGSERF